LIHDAGKFIHEQSGRESHVIVNGVVFPWDAKAPYVRSGQSTLGALEYHEESGEVKCHECGEWIGYLPRHIKMHGITCRDYRIKHGFRISAQRTRLCSPKLPRQPATSSALTRERTVAIRPRQMAAHRQKHSGGGTSAEINNLRSTCQAQIIKRVTELRDQIGKAPSVKALSDAGIHRGTIKNRFRVDLDEFYRQIGI
jgi:hypothetical protein